MKKVKPGIVRCCSLVVGSPVQPKGSTEPGVSWEQLNKALSDSWRLSTDLANWCVQRLFKLDDVNSPGTPKAVKEWNLTGYQDATANFPDWETRTGGIRKSAVSIIRQVHSKYLQHRRDVVFHHKQYLLTYKYPFPFPVPSQAYKLHYERSFPAISLALPRLGRITLRLKRDAKMRRQLAMFKDLESGQATPCEARILRNHKGDVLIKLAGRFPEPVEVTNDHVCLVSTSKDCLLIAEIDGRGNPWKIYSDNLVRWKKVHDVYLQRSSDDLKREKRMDPAQKRNFLKSRESRCVKHNNRVDTEVHRVTMQVVRFVERQKVGTVVYDDRIKDYIKEGFPWYNMKSKLQYKLQGIGVKMIDGATNGSTTATTSNKKRT